MVGNISVLESVTLTSLYKVCNFLKLKTIKHSLTDFRNRQYVQSKPQDLLGWTFLAVQLLNSVARQQPEPHHVDINSQRFLLLCPNFIYSATFYTSCPKHMRESPNCVRSRPHTDLPTGHIWPGVYRCDCGAVIQTGAGYYPSSSYSLSITFVCSFWGVLELPYVCILSICVV